MYYIHGAMTVDKLLCASMTIKDEAATCKENSRRPCTLIFPWCNDQSPVKLFSDGINRKCGERGGISQGTTTGYSLP